ncbi:MAG: prolyl oligopeptidase family serine peptidase [Ignavibacteriae bacterium]|nr:prolyl oligopeptidase family serine peptidase [Ignavibacteriota bacterium]
MKRILIIALIVLLQEFFGISICRAQNSSAWVVDTLANIPKVSEQEINFLSESPVIDGILDKQMEFLPIRQFGLISRNKTDTAVPISYRIAYGTEFLYIYIEAKAEHLTYRDRAYQNGDGFLLLIARPQMNNEPTDEFYELACSAVNMPEREWTRNIFWNYNVDKIFVPTSFDTKLEFREGNGIISFELILPWTDVRPYHPWLSEGIGFNLTFCKAAGTKGQVWYQVNDDDNTGAEFKKRTYTPLSFQKPVLKGNPQTFVSVKEGHTTEGQSFNATAVTVSNKAFKESVSIFLGTGERISGFDLIDYECTPGITKHEFSLNSNQALEGAYMLRWKSQNKISLGSTGLSVLPKFDEKELYDRLEINKKFLSKGAYSTVQFMVKELKDKIDALKIYETSASERFNLIRLMRMINSVNSGIDPFENNRGFIRKAYQSKTDNSLQPYVVYLPENFDKNKKYPLLVFLHGSASDETNIRGFLSLIPKDFIAVGPFGRGKSNAFSRDYAQEDIAEVISAVSEDYSIDTTRILLTGFSMGGYGVYRTFYETPSRYKALAVFSGAPNIGKKYAPGNLAPDFTDENNLNSFQGIPIFIFHGEKDLNVSLPATVDFVAKLKKTGAQVEFQVEPGKGHERPGADIIDIYMKWVESVMN